MASRPPIYPKKLNATEKIFYHFKLDATTYALFDSELDTALAHGSYNMVSQKLILLPKQSIVYYFEQDNSKGFKLKMTYKSDKTPANESDKDEKNS